MKVEFFSAVGVCALLACGGAQRPSASPKVPSGERLSGEQSSGEHGESASEVADPDAPGQPGSGAAGPGASPAPVAQVRQAAASVRARQYERAIREARAALRRSEKYVPAMVVMARAYYHLGKFEFAQSICLQSALKLRPKTGACYDLLGHVALRQKDPDLALKNFEKATQVEPGYGPGWLNYGAELLRVKNFAKAVMVSRRATELMPGRAEAFNNLASAYRGNGELVQARQTYLKALKIKPGNAKSFFNLGILYLDATKVFDGKGRLEQLDSAVRYFQRYKQTGAAGRGSNPVDDYIAQARKLRSREERRIKREARKKARAAAKPAAKPKEAKKE